MERAISHSQWLFMGRMGSQKSLDKTFDVRLINKTHTNNSAATSVSQPD